MDRWTISNATLKYKDTITLEFITKPTVLGLLDHSPPFVLPMTDTTSQQFQESQHNHGMAGRKCKLVTQCADVGVYLIL